MKHFVISLFISLPLLLANSVHAEEALPCGVDFDAMSIAIDQAFETELVQVANQENKYTVSCSGTTIADCEAKFTLDGYLAINQKGELIIAPNHYPLTCVPVV